VINGTVLGFASLEVDIVVLGTAASDRVSVWVKGAGSESLDLIHRKKFLPFRGIHEFDVLNLVRGTETIEVVHDRK